MSEFLLFICSAQTFPRIFWTIICLVRICRDDSFLMSLPFVSFTTNSCPFVHVQLTSKVHFTVYFTFKASQLLHHRKSPSSWLFFIIQPDTNHSLGHLANFAQVLPGLKLCSSFAHLAILQETHKPTFSQAESKTNNG